MFRFTMPDTSLPIPEQSELLREQFASFLKSDALSDIMSILETDLDNISAEYNKRTLRNGKVCEIHDIRDNNSLDKYRYLLYPLFKEIGFININKPVRPYHSHVVVLGGSYNSCHIRTASALNIIDDSTLFVDGLSCYRPINPVEKNGFSRSISADSEFGAITEAFIETFSLENYDIKEDFASNRNINSISNIRTFESGDNRTYRIMAAPSGEPDMRRANTADTLKFYMDNTDLSVDSTVIAVTNNYYCNRQFIQLVYEILKAGTSFNIDVVGCISDDSLITAEEYNPNTYTQELIALIDWINKFNDDSTTWN